MAVLPQVKKVDGTWQASGVPVERTELQVIHQTKPLSISTKGENARGSTITSGYSHLSRDGKPAEWMSIRGKLVLAK
jgi:hypothetical protein